MAFNVGDFGKAFSFIGSFSFIPGAAAFAVVGAGLMAVDPSGGEDPSELVLNPFSGGHPHFRHGPFWGIPLLKGDRETILFGLGWALRSDGHTPRHYDSLAGYPGDPLSPLQRVLARRRWRKHLLRDHWVLLPYGQDANSPNVRWHVDALWKPGDPFVPVWVTDSQEIDAAKNARANFWGVEVDTRAHIIKLTTAIREQIETRREPKRSTGWMRPRFQYDGGPSAELTEKSAPAIWREIALHDYIGARVAAGMSMDFARFNAEKDFDAKHPTAEWTGRAKAELAAYLALETEWEDWRAQVDQALALEKAKAEIIAAWEAAWASGQVPLPPPGLGGGPSPFGINPPSTYPIEQVSSVGPDPKKVGVTAPPLSIGTEVGSRVLLADEERAPVLELDSDRGAVLALAAALVGLLLLA